MVSAADQLTEADECDEHRFRSLGQVLLWAKRQHVQKGWSLYKFFKNTMQILQDRSATLGEEDPLEVSLQAVLDFDYAFFGHCFPAFVVTVFLSYFHSSVLVPNPLEHNALVNNAHDWARSNEFSEQWKVPDLEYSDFLSWQYELSIQHIAASADIFRPVYLDKSSTFESLMKGPLKGGRQKSEQELLRPTDLPPVGKLVCLEYFCEPNRELFQSLLVSGLLPHLGALAIVSVDDDTFHRLQREVDVPVVRSCNESEVPYILGPADDWRLLPMHISRLLLMLTAAVEALLTESVSAVSMRHHILDAASNTIHLRLLLAEQENAFSVANLSPVYDSGLANSPVQHDSFVFLQGLQGQGGKGHLSRASRIMSFDELMQSFRVAGVPGNMRPEDELKRLKVSVSKCGHLSCFFVGDHAFPDLPMQDIYLFRKQDSFAPAEQHCEELHNDWMSFKTSRSLAASYDIPPVPKKYNILALASEGLFAHVSNEVFTMAYYMPVASLGHHQRHRRVQFIPVDFFGACREQHGWLLVDFIQALQLFLLQGLKHVAVVEPLMAHVPHEMRCLNDEWMTTPELIQQLASMTWEKMQSFAFREFFDVGHFRSELSKFSVDETIPWHEFRESEGVVDALFLLNDVALRGGLVTRGIYELEPILRCQDRPEFNQEIGFYNDSRVFVRRLICLQGTGSNMMNMEKFKSEVSKVLAESSPKGPRLAFQLYNWNGLERLMLQGMDLGKAAQAQWLPSMWSTLRFSASMQWLADRVVQRMKNRSQDEVWSFTAAHLRWRNFSKKDGSIPYQHPSTEYGQTQKLMTVLSDPVQYSEVLQDCVPESLQCGHIFLMTNLPQESELLQSLNSSYSTACGPGRMHSINDDLLPPSDLRAFLQMSGRHHLSLEDGWSPLHGFFLEVAIATSATFFLGHGTTLGAKASAVSKITVKLRSFQGRGFWCHGWAFDPYCDYRSQGSKSYYYSC